jgi:predicted nuclease of restriction endonuclease-like (RecB) superfamily
MTIETNNGAEPAGYEEFIADLKQRVRTTQFRAMRAANTEVMRLYWSVGRDILDRQKNEGWGAKVVDQISADMRREFVGQRGWSTRSLKYMRKLADGWPVETEFVQQAAAQLPGKQIAERDREQALMDRIQDTLLELGRGMAFVGRQYRIEVGGDEFFVDLLFFHVTQLRYVVVELKVGKFQPAHIGQIGTYVAMVDGEIRKPDLHAQTVGILLCTERNDATLDYALASTASPVAVALYEGLTPEERAALPSPGELETVIEEEIQVQESLIAAPPAAAGMR